MNNKMNLATLCRRKSPLNPNYKVTKLRFDDRRRFRHNRKFEICYLRRAVYNVMSKNNPGLLYCMPQNNHNSQN